MSPFYSPARRPDDEGDRQRAVDRSGFKEAQGDPTLAGIIREATDLFGTPMAAISIVDEDRQFFPVEAGIGAEETPRAASFCAHAMLDRDRSFCVPDATEDSRFAGNPLVLSAPDIRFYLGIPLVARDGQPLGALCVLDRVRARCPVRTRSTRSRLSPAARRSAPPKSTRLIPSPSMEGGDQDQDVGFSAFA